MLFRKKKKPTVDTRQRNTGSGQKVNSYYTASKKQITTFQRHTSTEPAKKSVGKIIKTYSTVVLGSTLLIIALFAMVTLSSTASIRIENGGEYRTPEQYQSIINEALQKQVNNKFKLTLDSNGVAEDIKRQLPEAYNVAVYAPLFGRNPEVIITTAAPFAVLQQDNAPSLVMSERGRLVLETTQSVVDSTHLATITNESGTRYNTNDQLFKPDEMASLRALQFQYTKGDINLQGSVAYVLPIAPREIHTKEGTYIAKFSLNDDANITQQFGALRAVQAQLQAQDKTPQEYIDVRLASKVFIR